MRSRISGYSSARSLVSVRSWAYVEEEPAAGGLALNRFPISVADGSFESVFPEKPVVRLEGSVFEGGSESLPRKRVDVVAVGVIWIRGSSEFDGSGHDVDDVARSVDDRPRFGLYACGPVHDERGGDAAFVALGFIATERSIGSVGPALTVRDAAAFVFVVDVGDGAASEVGGAAWLFSVPRFGASPVVGKGR